jgi:hypothetical protein
MMAGPIEGQGDHQLDANNTQLIPAHHTLHEDSSKECRICRCGEDEGKLIRACRSVMCLHDSRLRVGMWSDLPRATHIRLYLFFLINGKPETSVIIMYTDAEQLECAHFIHCGKEHDLRRMWFDASLVHDILWDMKRGKILRNTDAD